MAEVRIVKPDQRDTSTAQTPGMFRAEGCGAKTVGAEHLWVGHVSVDKGVRSGAHHHGELESVDLRHLWTCPLPFRRQPRIGG